MKLVLQRVTEASVSVDGRLLSSIGPGLLVFLCIEKGDGEAVADHYARKVTELRIFPDEAGKMNRSVKETGGSILLISQFTLAADVEKGRRPSFDRAAPAEEAERRYSYFAQKIREEGITVQTGIFQAHMNVALVNDGPVTILLGNRSTE